MSRKRSILANKLSPFSRIIVLGGSGFIAVSAHNGQRIYSHKTYGRSGFTKGANGWVVPQQGWGPTAFAYVLSGGVTRAYATKKN